MTPYVTRFIPEEELALFERVKAAVQEMPDIDLGVDERGRKVILSCHMLARAVSRVFGLEYADGYFCRSYQHSWNVTKDGHIIDVYPVATIGGPLLVDGQVASPARTLYTKTSAKTMSRGRFGQNSFRRSVSRIVHALK